MTKFGGCIRLSVDSGELFRVGFPVNAAAQFHHLIAIFGLHSAQGFAIVGVMLVALAPARKSVEKGSAVAV